LLKKGVKGRSVVEKGEMQIDESLLRSASLGLIGVLENRSAALHATLNEHGWQFCISCFYTVRQTWTGMYSHEDRMTGPEKSVYWQESQMFWFTRGSQIRLRLLSFAG
jgi:hypothetical protein